MEVLVGKTPAGETPLRLMTVRSGTYTVTLRHPDYETVSLPDQRFADGEVLRIDHITAARHRQADGDHGAGECLGRAGR